MVPATLSCILDAMQGSGNGADDDGVLDDFKAGVDAHIRPGDVQTHLDLGLAYTDMGLPDDAEGEFNEVLAIEPNNAAAKAGLEALRRRREEQ